MARQCCATGTLLWPEECPFHDATAYGPVPDDYPTFGRGNVEPPRVHQPGMLEPGDALEAIEAAKLNETRADTYAMIKDAIDGANASELPIVGPKVRVVKTDKGWGVVVGSFEQAIAAVRRQDA